MAKSIKLKNNTYIDSSGIVHNKTILKDIFNNMFERYDYTSSGTMNSSRNYDTTCMTISNEYNKRIYAIISATIKYQTNSNEDRALAIFSQNNGELSYEQVKSCNSNTTRINIVYPMVFGVGEKAYIKGFQNSGNNLSYDVNVKVLYFNI